MLWIDTLWIDTSFGIQNTVTIQSKGYIYGVKEGKELGGHKKQIEKFTRQKIEWKQ